MELPQEPRRLSNVTENRSERVHSLFTSAALNKGPLASRDTMHTKVSDFSSVRYSQDQSKNLLAKDQGKDKDKESTGSRLLNMLRQTLQESESEEVVVKQETPTLVPFGDVVGCLAVHIKNCRQLIPKISSQHRNSLFFRISVNNIVKCTKTHSLKSTANEKNPVIKFNDVKYFSVQVPRRQEDERNKIFLELMQYDETGKFPTLIGSVEVHLYQIIQKGCFTEELQILHDNTLKPLQKHIQPSMFMNIAPPPERTDPQTNVITPQPVEYPAFLSPDLNVTIGTRTDVKHPNQTPVVRLEKLQQQPRERLERMKKVYRNLNTWTEKADYLGSIINPKLGHKDSKEGNVTEVLENQSNNPYEEMSVKITLDVPVIQKESETTSNELQNNNVKKDSIIPTFTIYNEDEPIVIPPKIEQSTLSPRESPFLTIPNVEIPQGDKMPPLNEYQLEAMPEEKKKYVPFTSELQLNVKYPRMIKTDSSPTQESPISEHTKFPYLEDPFMNFTNLGYKNANKKERSVAFSQKEYTSPSSRPEFIDFKPKYQKFQKGSFDPFLRNINNKTSVRKRKDKDIYKCINILSTEVIEHEDQDPPYPAHLKTSGSPNTAWAHDPNLIMLDTKSKLSPDTSINKIKTSDAKNKLQQDPTIKVKTSDAKNKLPHAPTIHTIKISDTKNKLPKTSDTKNKLPHDPPTSNTIKTSDTKNKLGRNPTITTTKTSDTKNKLARNPTMNTTKTSDTKNKLVHDPDTIVKALDTKLQERLPNVPFSNFKEESSVTENVNTHHSTKSSSLTSDIENLKQSMILKSILSKNLQDLSDKLFSKPEVCVNTEAIKDDYSPLVSAHDKPPSNMEEMAFEKIHDLNSWLSEKDILNSKTLLSQIIKNISADVLSEGEPGKSPEVEGVSTKLLSANEIDLPMKTKDNLKKNHLISEVSSSKSNGNGKVHDYIIKQIFTAPIFAQLGAELKELSEAQLNLQDQLPKSWETSLSSNILINYGKKDDEIQLTQSKSVISQIIQAFPVDTLLESGIIKVIELDKEYQSSLLYTETTSTEEESKDSTEDYSEIKSKTESLPGQNIPSISQDTSSPISNVEFVESSQTTALQDSKYSILSEKPDLSSEDQKLDAEESDVNSTLEKLSNSLTDKLNESDTMLKSFLKNIFNVFFKYNQSERKRQPEKELERLIQHSLPSGIEHFGETKKDFNKADKLDKKSIFSPKLRVFLEKLSESEVKNLKSELSKHIQHYLVERLLESGHITKEDLTKIHQNLYLMNEKRELKGQNISQEKYSETVKEIMSFVNNFNHHFIDKHLEIKLRSFLSEILQNYFLKNLSKGNLFNETESVTLHSNISSLKTESAPISFHELQDDILRGSFGKRLEINMKCPFNKSLQKYFVGLSENELLNLKANLGNYLQDQFIEKLSRSGLMTERQLKGLNQHKNALSSSSIPLKYIKTDLPFRDENYFMQEHSEKQNENSNFGQNPLQKTPEDKSIEAELIKMEEEGSSFSLNLKENPSTIREQKNYYSRDGANTLSLIKIQPSSSKNTKASPSNKSSEGLTDIVLKKHKKEQGFMQFSQGKHSFYKAEIQDLCSWDGKSKIIQSKACFERTLKPLGKQENVNIYKLTVQQNPEAGLSPHPRIPNCKMPREDEEYLNRLTFPSWQTSTFIHFNSESEEPSKLDQYCQRLKGNNNNNKKHLVTFAQFDDEMQTLYVDRNEIYNAKYTDIPESQSFKNKGEKNSKSPFFPEVLKRENVKLKVRKERDNVAKPKRSFNKIVRILPATSPATLPATRTPRKSVPRTLLHWTARRTIHDCLDKIEDLHVPSINHPKKTKSRARLLGRSPDDSHNEAKHCVRPYTAPEPNRQDSATGKFASPRMVSAGIVHINDTTPDYEMHKMWPKKY